MKSLRKILLWNLEKLSCAMMGAILFISVILQVVMVQNQAKENAHATFIQISQVLKENQAELTELEAEYRETCLHNAEAIAYMIQHHPEILGDVEEFRMIAQMMEVDEIHIFDTTGRIFTGSHPEYYDFTFETGEQIGFFKPMMYDKTLRLCQDITPNTAEGKLVQYSALWSDDGEFIVQVGMYPETVLEVTEKNELSHIFSLLQGNPGVSLYAIDGETGEIMGSTNGADTGKELSEIGLTFSSIAKCQKGAHVTINGVNSYGIFTEIDGNKIGYILANDVLYSIVPTFTLVMAISLVVIATMIVIMARKFTNHYVVNGISGTNEKLRAIVRGNLNERVDEQSSLEFSELSSHINQMIRSLLSSTEKMNFVLDKTNLQIGVYEYNQEMKTVRFTEHVPKILNLHTTDENPHSAELMVLKQAIDVLRSHPVPGEADVYYDPGRQERYVKLEEVSDGMDILGIVVDVTEEVLRCKRIEAERDIDLLTGLYNRRGMIHRLNRIFSDATIVRQAAIVMVDADDLKLVNDSYGHAVGDLYLKAIADELRGIGEAKQVTARLGGDEFALCLYGYDEDETLEEELKKLRQIQMNTVLYLENGHELQVRFSFGYVITDGRTDYTAMLDEADGYMYEIKRRRKQGKAACPTEPEA